MILHLLPRYHYTIIVCHGVIIILSFLGEQCGIIFARNVPQEGGRMAVQYNEIQELLRNRADLHDEPDRMHSSTRTTRPS